MGFNRTSRAGQLHTLPVLCDDVLQARIHASISGAALRAIEGVDDEAAQNAAMEAAATAEAQRIFSEHARLVQYLDESALTMPLDGVARVTFRGLSGAQMADAESAGKLAATRAKAKDPAPFIAVELLRVGLVAVEEFDATPGVNGYPVEVLYAPGGMAAWAAFRDEVSTRIRTWSTLGELALSPSVP